MELTDRELWTAIHGMIFGAAYLLAFAGGLAGLYSLRPEWTTAEGITRRLGRLKIGLWVLAGLSWATVISGTYIVYPWYRAKPPEGAELVDYPRSLLLDATSTAHWHKFGMEWKEHVAWLCPLSATLVAFAVTYYGVQLANKPRERWALIGFHGVAFATAAIAGLFGAFITKTAPVL